VQLSIIILNYKVPYYLLHCLASVKKAVENSDAEIIVVDNNSEDESINWVKIHFPEVKTIALKENLGFSKGNNVGVKAAKGKYICLLNPDTLVPETIFTRMLAFAEKNPDFGALGPQLIDGNGNFLAESKRNVPTPKVALQKLLGSSKNYYAQIPENENSKVSVLVGAFMFMKKNNYLKVGGLDEDYFMYGEDIDLSFALLKQNYQNYYLGEESVLHYKGESTVKNKAYRDAFYGAMKIFYAKNFSQNRLSKTLINTGLSLAKKMHPSVKQIENPSEKNKDVFYLGKDENVLRKLKRNYSNIKKISENELNKSPNHSILIIDLNRFTYAEALTILKENQNKDFRFRMKPKSFDFIIGSDQNAARGEIVEL
jgi:GT2 family glycosyltransferase